MRTEEKGYSDYLENKYLPGRRVYLNRFFYPKLFRRFNTGETIIDLGCGTGEFLNYCRGKNRQVIGVDSNTTLAKKCRESGFEVVIDSVCELSTLKGRRFKYAVCDNVLEHLELEEVGRFFERMDELMLPDGTLVCVVPGVKGFKNDPTHKTYVTYDLVNNLLTNSNLKIEAYYHHPLNLRGVDKCLYLNMQVFEIRKTRVVAASSDPPQGSSSESR